MMWKSPPQSVGTALACGIFVVAVACSEQPPSRTAESDEAPAHDSVTIRLLQPTDPERFTCPGCRIQVIAATDFGEGVYAPHRMGNTIKRDAHGRFWTARTYEEGVSAVYDSAGGLITQIGREGQGPGEMGFISAMAEASGNMYLADRKTHRLNVFDDSLRLVRSHPLKFSLRSMSVSADNKLVAWFWNPYGPTPGAVHLLSDSGRYITPILPAEKYRDELQQMLHGDVVLATSRNGDVLIADAADYSITIIREGKVLTELKSPVGWFDSYAEYSRDNPIPLARTYGLEVDEENRAWILFNLPNPKFRPERAPKPASDKIDPVTRTLHSANTAIEVWDLNTGKLLTGILVSPRLIGFADSHHAYTYIETASGEVRARVWRFMLDEPIAQGARK